MAKGNFDACADLVFGHEQGYVNNPKDPGGATNWGVTINTLSTARKHKVTVADVIALTKTEARGILKAMYWDVVKGDDMPIGLDHAMFDFCVNSGPNRATKEAQKLLPGIAADGVMGPKTVLALQSVADLRSFIQSYCAARLAFDKSLGTWSTFGRGWTRRITGVDPQGQYKKQLGVVGEALAMVRVHPVMLGLMTAPEPDATMEKPQGIEPAPDIEMGKARDSDRKLTATSQGQMNIATVGMGILTVLSLVIPMLITQVTNGSLVLPSWLPNGLGTLTMIGIVVNSIITANKQREEGEHA